MSMCQDNVKIMFLFLIFSMPLACFATTDYCSLCENGFHTMCLYPKDGPGPSCLDYRRISFTQNQKKYIVDIHNDIRNHVASGLETKGKLGNQPPASNMLQLEWEEDLARIAQRWADQCIPVNATKQHDTCKRTSKFDNVGQNILTAVTNGTDVSELAVLILNWYKQVVNVIPSDIDYFEGIKRGQFLIGQYTQLVWGKTRTVGCGMAIYKDSPRGFYNQRLVCNYGPGGNIIGQPVYLQGIPCSGCPKSRCDNVRKNLCESTVAKRSVASKSDFLLIMNQVLIKRNPMCVLSPEFAEMYSDKCRNFVKNNDKAEAEETGPVYDIFSKVSEHDEYNHTFDLGTTGINIVIKNYTRSINWSESIMSDISQFKNEIVVMNLTNKNRKLEEAETTPQYWITPEANVRFKRAVGKWYNGECKCDRIYRSRSTVIASATYLMHICVVIMFYIFQ